MPKRSNQIERTGWNIKGDGIMRPGSGKSQVVSVRHNGVVISQKISSEDIRKSYSNSINKHSK